MFSRLLKAMICTILIFIPFSEIKVKAEALNEMASFFEENEGNIKKVQLTYKESLPKSELHAIIDKVELFGFKKEQSSSDKIKFMRKDTHETNDIIETYNIIMSSDGQSFTAVASFESTIWDDEISTYIDSWQTEMNSLFTKDKVHKFVCLQTEINGIIEDGVFLKKLMDHFQLQQIDTQSEQINEETYREVIYGNTPLWSDGLEIAGEQMNMQVALTHNKHNGTKITIGTPILIYEY